MERIKPDPKNDFAFSLGDAKEEEFTFLLVPVPIYSLISQYAKREGCSVGEIFQKALLEYVNKVDAAVSRGMTNNSQQGTRAEPDISLTRKRK